MSATLDADVDTVTVRIKVNSTTVATFVAAGMTVPGTLAVTGVATLGAGNIGTNASGSRTGMTGSVRLDVAQVNPKATADAEQQAAFFGSSDTAYPLGLSVGFHSHATAGSRYVTIDGSEVGSVARPLYIQSISNGTVVIGGSTATVTLVNLAGAGSRTVNADANGLLSAASDSSMKQEVFTKLPGLAEILLLQPKAYKWTKDIAQRGDSAAVEVGFFADQVAPIIPSAAPMGNDGLYGFYDRSVTAALVIGMQQQEARLRKLEQLENA